MSNCRIQREGGFTLIEIIIAMAILALFIGVIYSSFFGTIRAIRATEELSDSFQPAMAILSRIQRDLKGTIHRLDNPCYVFNGIDGYGNDPNHDRIDFITCSHMITDRDIPQSDLSEVSYYIDKSHYGSGYLVRREDLYLDEEPDKGGELKIIGENVSGLNFQYFLIQEKYFKDITEEEKKERDNRMLEIIPEPENWCDEWDWEEHPYIPIMVKIELTMTEEDGNETTFSTIVYLNRDQDTVQKANTRSQSNIDDGTETEKDAEDTEKPKGPTYKGK